MAALAQAMDCFPLEGFNHENIVVYRSLICFVSGVLWCLIYGYLPCYFNMVSKPSWGPPPLLIYIRSRCDCMWRLLWGFTISDHFQAGRTAPLCLDQWGSPFASYEKVSIFPIYGHFTISEVYSSFFLQSSFISLRFIWISVLSYLFYQICNFFFVYAIFPKPLCDLGKSKAEEKFIFLLHMLLALCLCVISTDQK